MGCVDPMYQYNVICPRRGHGKPLTGPYAPRILPAVALLDHHRELPQMNIMKRQPKSPKYAGIGCKLDQIVLATNLGDLRSKLLN